MHPLENGLPANPGAERSVLGSILIDNDIFPDESLRAADFSLDSNRRVFAAMLALRKRDCPISLVTVAEELRTRNELDSVGGLAYLSSLTEGAVADAKHVAYCAKRIRHAAGLRHVHHAAEALASQASDPTAALADLVARFSAFSSEVAEYDSARPRITTLADIPDPFSLNAEVRWTVRDLIPAGAVTVLNGEPGAGKTWLALAIANSVTLGKDFLGRRSECAGVLYLDRENPLALIRERLERVCGGAGVLRPWGRWCDDQPPMIGDPRLLEFASKGLLIVFDSLIRFHEKDENSATEMSTVTNQLRALADAGGTVLVLHHRGKAETSIYRGSSEIAGGPDVACMLSKVDGGLLQLKQTKNRFAPEITLTLRPDFDAGSFEVVDSPALAERRDDIASIAEVIASKPGINQKQLIKELGMNRTDASKLLKSNDRNLWRTEHGTYGSLLYFPATSTQYQPVPGTAGTPPATCTAVPTPLGVVQGTAPEKA